MNSIPIAYAQNSTQQLSKEINVLIDVSGSMKQNDPNNLRISALKLLINLLPDGVTAGVWTFAEKTNRLIEVEKVDEQWKQNALAKIKKIHSNGLFTHIEDAIQTSAQQWLTSSEKHKQNRHLILLTDGMVDVSKDIMQSAESRERVLAELIPLLQIAGVNVQTIALSDNADGELLDKLAFDTNGWSETAESAEQLERVFFNMFKKTVSQDTVPLIGNAFTIDPSIKEFSLLVFKKADSPETKLIAPDNTSLDSTNKSDKAVWLKEKNYDLITIKSPVQGEWKIVADMDPDNQVMIVTDLKFQLDQIPNHIAEKEDLVLNAYFTDQQQLISKKEFLDLIEISIEQSSGSGVSGQWQMLPLKDKPGMFSQTLHALEKGKHRLKISVDGKTFKREHIQTIEVVASPVRVETAIKENEKRAVLSLIVNDSIINTDMMTVQATINQAGKSPDTRIVENKAGSWAIEIPAPEQGENKIINFSIMAQTQDGKAIAPDIKPIIINDSMFKKKETASKGDVASAQKALKKEEKIAEPIDKEPVDVEDENELINWMKISLIVLVINLALILAGFLGVKFSKKKAAEKQAELLDRLS